MVYCGKASQGCQSCRTRRIKCDKLRPDCSQCVRVGKKCPGYRDQLSLMFRDESSKVMQKAHAQWGVGDGLETASQASGSSPRRAESITSTALTAREVSPSNTSQTIPSPPASYTGSVTSVTSVTSAKQRAAGFRSRINSSVVPTLDEQGLQFYVNRYLIGHPDEPRNSDELKSYTWLFDPKLREAYAALGLAGLSNLRNDQETMLHARTLYGKALRAVGEIIQANRQPELDITSRMVVALAMFELVKGTELSTGSVFAHVAGGAALIRSFYPMRATPCGGLRPLLQLCYSTFLSAYDVGIPLPSMFHDWINFAQRILPPEDQPGPLLGPPIAKFIRISSFVRFSVLSDGKDATNSTLRQLIDTDVELAQWESSLTGMWHFAVVSGPHLPPAAVFEGKYHEYHDLWVARMWNTYRWARILLNQMILDVADKFPISGGPLVSPADRKVRLAVIKQLSRDVLISTASHWRHPLLGDQTPLPAQQQGGGGAGSAGVPILLFQLQAAACAPGVPLDYWCWAYNIIECVWGDMGMLHAKKMMDYCIAHREELDNPKPRSPGSPVAAKAPEPKEYMTGLQKVELGKQVVCEL